VTWGGFEEPGVSKGVSRKRGKTCRVEVCRCLGEAEPLDESAGIYSAELHPGEHPDVHGSQQPYRVSRSQMALQ
jgi:hypothetical protein